MYQFPGRLFILILYEFNFRNLFKYLNYFSRVTSYLERAYVLYCF